MRIAVLMCLLAAVALAGSADAEEKPIKVLRGRLILVSQQKRTVNMQKVVIKVHETGNSGLTDDDGAFRIELASPMKAGQEVTLAHDKKGYAIPEPLFGKLLLPRDERPGEIRMLPLGSKLFWTDDRLETWIEQVANDAAKKWHPKEEPIRSDLGKYNRKLGREYGFTEAEVRREIRSWIEGVKKRKSSLRAQALANYAEENFDLAAKMALKWAEEVDQEAARAYSLAGDAFVCGPKSRYGEAIAAYEKALSRVERSREATAWWDIRFKLAKACVESATCAEPPQAGLALRRAATTYRELLQATDRKTQKQRWAMTQNNLGIALDEQADLAEGKETARLLVQAIRAYHAALEVYTKDNMPQYRATVERNLERALDSLQKLKKQAPPPEDNMAHLLVFVPENAELWFNGTKTRQTGAQREFVSPALTPGKSYSYELKAKWTENGKTVEETRTIRVQANTWHRIDFTKAKPSADKKNGPHPSRMRWADFSAVSGARKQRAMRRTTHGSA